MRLLGGLSESVVFSIHRSPRLTFFLSHRPTKEQFRIQGRCFLYSGPGTPSASYLPARLAPYDGFDWEQERLRIFAKMSPPLKATFLRPVGGTALDKAPFDYKTLPQELSDEPKDKEWRDKAYVNFSLMVIEPEYVDRWV